MKVTNPITQMLMALFIMSTMNFCSPPSEKKEDAEQVFKITSLDDPDLFGSKIVKLENSVFSAEMRLNGPHHTEKGYTDGYYYWHNIRNFVFKKHNIDQALGYGAGIDCNHFRGNCFKTEMVQDDEEQKTIRLYYHSTPKYILSEADLDTTTSIIVSEYTIYPNSPVIKVKYVNYSENSGWANIFDIGAPGGIKEQYKAKTKVYGQDGLAEGLVYHEEALWQGFEMHEKGHVEDAPDGGSLSYKDNLIMVVGNPENGIGFGRVMPIFKPDVQGGVQIFKLLWDQGFEVFPSTHYTPKAQQKSFQGYIFLFDGGLDQGIERGKAIADGDLLLTGQ